MLFLNLALVGCSSLTSRSSARNDIDPEIRNVPVSARDEAPRKRILVLPFLDASTRRSETIPSVARSAVISWLARTNRFVIVNNDDFPKDVSQYLENGEYNLEAVAKIAAGMGVAAVIEGKVLEIKARRIGDRVGIIRSIHANVDATIQIRTVATKNSKEILNIKKSASIRSTTQRVGKYSYSDKDLEEDPKLVHDVTVKAFKGVIKPLALSIDKLSWEGRVALVKGEQIFINAGRLSGLQVGDVLKVTESSEEVYDPDSGALIGHVPGRMKGTLEVVSYFGRDGSITVLHSGAGILENDRVELY